MTSRAAETQKKAPPSLNHRGNAVGVSGGAFGFVGHIYPG
ncbi:hypothetical protein SEA_MINDY_38 [Mycobacterium phage Mindy]|uniref:Uncharacterized protein n=1 Tax=Mycobacterium phage Mindy TaxID=1647311 RepID=A0A0F6YQZ7_9CAUD|nr:hypothetical protein SEA_MINDY_38 [Mycobacterium phage Mindy]AKF15068.1 hypothetical protein SEA_MINDY_38 [Mycobacterium phage Mindy]